MSNTAAAKKQYVERIVAKLDEIDVLRQDIKEIYTEIKSGAHALGFEPKEIREAIALMRKDPKNVVGKINKALKTLREIGEEINLDEAFS